MLTTDQSPRPITAADLPPDPAHGDRPAAGARVEADPLPPVRRRRRPAPRLADRRATREALHRQRLLADRTGSPLCVVAFACANRQQIDRLSRLLATRRRATDDVGLAPRELCLGLPGGASRCVVAALPGTTAEGGRAFAEDVTGRFGQRDRPAVRVMAYAAERGPARREDDDDDHDGDLFARRMPAWKRFADVAAAGVGLAALGPLMALVALAIRLDSTGPAIFWQNRAGRGGRPFAIAKFRTMVADAESKRHLLQSEQDGAAFKLRRDPRVTRVGRLLRQTSLDELPQLWNVLRGDMTLVGPRPLPVHESDACLAWQRRRLDVTPGLTCIWQVHGRSRVLFDEWMRMDLRYVRRSAGALGPVHDATLVLKTLPAVFLKRGY